MLSNVVKLVMDPPVMETAFAFWIAIVPSPNVVLPAEASASSTKLLPKEVNVARAAVPEPVKYGSVSAADVNPANAVRSPS